MVTITGVAIVFCPPPRPMRCTSLAAGSQGGTGSYGNTTEIQTEGMTNFCLNYKCMSAGIRQNRKASKISELSCSRLPSYDGPTTTMQPSQSIPGHWVATGCFN